MRISDWSSDVCSSDLRGQRQHDADDDLQPLLRGERVQLEHPHRVGQQLVVAVVGRKDVVRERRLQEVAEEAPGIRVRDARRQPPHAATPASAYSSVSAWRSEEHTSELQSLMRISYAVFCLKKTNRSHQHTE